MELRKVIGYEDYSIYENGEIVSYKRNAAGTSLVAGVAKSGYRTVTLSNRNGPKTISVHRLVAENYADKLTDPIEGQVEIDHIDENKLNNHHSNLRWCTGKENKRYHLDNNPHKKSKGISTYKPVDPAVKKQNKDAASKRRSELLGKEFGNFILVDGVSYDAVRQAARHIVECEYKNGISRNIETVRKELKRFTQGKRVVWDMYGRYSIGS